MTAQEFIDEWRNGSDYVAVSTSGSTGAPKRMLVEKKRMRASARITCDFLGLKPGDSALLCMSADYIAGKMMIVRALERGLSLDVVEPCGHPFAQAPRPYRLVAMVPLQAYNTISVPQERKWLEASGNIIIGGGAIDSALEAELRKLPCAVWSSYGMTETLSHIALRRVNGPDSSEWFTPFEGVNVSLSPEGCLVIDAPSVCSEILHTRDIAALAPDGRRFKIIGRIDNVICSGGLKLQIEEIESMLKPNLPWPFMIAKVPDAKFGEAAVLLLQGGDCAMAEKICASCLPKHQRPKHVFSVVSLPTTPTGKPARAEALKMSIALMREG